MVNEGLRGIVVSLLIVGLFSFSLISFGVNFANDNQLNQSIYNDSRINAVYTNIQGNLSNSQSTAEGQKETLESEQGTIGSDSIILSSLQATRTVFSGIALGVYSAIVGLISDVLFDNSFGIVTVVLSAIILITIALLGWRLFKVGE